MKKYITEKKEDYSILDKRTGELLDYYQTKKVSIDNFIMVFFTCFKDAFKLEGNPLKLLMGIWKCSTFSSLEPEANLFHNDKMFKEKIRSIGLNFTDSAIDVYVSQIKKTGLIIQVCKGCYMLNPKYFFKGTLSNRSKLTLNIEVESEYTEEDETD